MNNRLRKFPLDQVLNHNVMDSIVGGGVEENLKNIQSMLERERRAAEAVERAKKGIGLGKGFYVGGTDDILEYRNGNHKVGYTPNKVTYTKSSDCVIL